LIDEVEDIILVLTVKETEEKRKRKGSIVGRL
jgi:hypothetical protein